MQQLFNTRNYSVRDFEEWDSRGELVLAPKFQRRDVWNDKARSFLIDTIVRGKPIPKIYMRQDTNPQTRRTIREIVDGQQRLKTVLLFLKDGFKISKAHHEDYGGMYFSDLDRDTQRDVLKYEFVVDLLQDMPDNEVYDAFARLNTYSEKLRSQELRNAKWFGEFKSCVYALSKEFSPFLEMNKIFTPKQMLRMGEAEFISELLLAMHEGIREGKKSVIDNAYEKYDDSFPGRRTYEQRFRQTIDTIGGIGGSDLPDSAFRSSRMFYALFCAVYHENYGLPRISLKRTRLRTTDFSKLKVALDGIDDLIERFKEATDNNQELVGSSDELRFYDAYTEHWVHADKRKIRTEYICREFAKALKR